jgi:hypothetical protein
MAKVTTEITVKQLQKKLKESFLSDDVKASYEEVLEQMNDDEKTELLDILEAGEKAKTDYAKDRLEKLARLNAALKKHLQNSIREEEKYIREQFETLEVKEEKEEMAELEKEINAL